MKQILTNLLFILVFLFTPTSVVSAQLPSNISPKQMEQFKQLSPAQQNSLAKSMGVDIKSIRSQMKDTKSTDNNNSSDLQQYFPRGTEFDDQGNPLSIQEQYLDEEESDEPKPFGYEVFANAPLTFAPSFDVAIPDNYMVGTGDVLNIQIFGKENNEYELEVSREGKILIPELGAFSVSGMEFNELKNYLRKNIQNQILGVDVVLTLAELRSIRVFILGEAYKPGNYVLSSLSSITHAIFSAGGISDIGSLRNIQLKRAGKLIKTLDLYDFLINGDSTDDVILKSGDVVFVAPLGQTVTVDGEVKRPAIYELAGGESIGTVLKMTGGLLPSAYPSSTVIERFNSKSLRSIVNVDLSEPKSWNNKVQSGDYIQVMKTSDIYEKSVSIIGAVSRPGVYQWKKNQKVTDLLPDISSYLLESADLNYSLIVRQTGDGRDIEILQFSLKTAISKRLSKDNLILKPLDKLLVFSNVEIFQKELESLNDLATTQKELKEREKDLAEEKYKEKLFWEQYGENGKAINPFEDEDKAEETLNKAKETLLGLSKDEIEEIDVKDFSFFSRKRLLAPVLSKLAQQASLNNPIKTVEVDGAVKFPGTYPLALNSTIKGLIIASGGLLESAFIQKAELSRTIVTQNLAEKKLVDINILEAFNNASSNLKLKSKDRLNVNHIPSWQKTQTVELLGEFRFPGKYTVRRGETLAQLIDRAGGFTRFAYIEASLFTREKLKEIELKNLIDVSENLRTEIASKSLSSREGGESLDYEQAKLLLADLTKVEPVGRLVLDINKILSDKSSDILLEDGDILYVSAKQNTINVVGQVQVATSHLYTEGLTAFDYIEQSGGAKKQADNDRIYIIKANGAVQIPSNGNWFAANGDKLRPGDTVVVPLDSYFMDDLTLWQTATQIFYQASIGLAAITRL